MKVILYEGQLQKQHELLPTRDAIFSLNPPALLRTTEIWADADMGRCRHALIVTTSTAESELRPELEWSESIVLPAGVGVGAGFGKILPTIAPTRSRSVPAINRQLLGPNGYALPRKY